MVGVISDGIGPVMANIAESRRHKKVSGSHKGSDCGHHENQ
jgi:hypothetical protein